MTRYCIGSEFSPEQGEVGSKIGSPFSGYPERDIPRICAHRPGSSGAGGVLSLFGGASDNSTW